MMRRRLEQAWLRGLNFVVLQWFFMRLARSQDAATGVDRGFVLWIGWVPLTGWITDAIFIVPQGWRLVWL